MHTPNLYHNCKILIVLSLSLLSYACSGETTGTGTDTGEITGYDLSLQSKASNNTNGTEGQNGNNHSFKPWINGDGAMIAFRSAASNLVPGDNNGKKDIFVRNLLTGKTTRVSVASDGTQADGNSYAPSITPDGRYVAFRSWAANLVPGDNNNAGDIFVHELATGETTRVNVDSSGNQGEGDSGYSPADDTCSGNDGFFPPVMSDDGRYITFASGDSRLVNNDNQGLIRWRNRNRCDGGSDYIDVPVWDVFLHDRQTGDTTLVSIGNDSSPGDSISDDPAISADGRYVAFRSFATNLTADDPNPNGVVGDVFVRDMQTGATTLISVSSALADENGNETIYRSNGRTYPPAISADGRYVVFPTYSNRLLGKYLDETDGAWKWVDNNRADDVYVHDRQTGNTTRVSESSSGEQGNLPSYWSSISADGRYIVFSSRASNFAPNDSNGVRDIFVRDMQTGATRLVSVDVDGNSANGRSWVSSISRSGRYISFGSYASNLVQGDAITCGDRDGDGTANEPVDDNCSDIFHLGNPLYRVLSAITGRLSIRSFAKNKAPFYTYY